MVMFFLSEVFVALLSGHASLYIWGTVELSIRALDCRRRPQAIPGVSGISSRSCLTRSLILCSGKIAELLSPGSVDPLTRLVLVNAVYFKGNWNEQFDKENTEERRFKVSKVSKVP